MAKKQKVTVVGSVLTIEYPTINKKFVSDLDKYPAEMQKEMRYHGGKQKFGDAESGGTPAEKYAMVQRIHDGLLAGQWELTGTIDLTPVICEAVSNIKKIPLAKVKAAAEKSPEKVKEWGSNVKVKAEIARMRAVKAAIAAENAEDLNIEV